MNFRMKYSKEEIKELFKSWFVISLIFTIAFKGLTLDPSAIFTFGISAFTVGLGFILHELAHKYLAQKYGCWAEFRAHNRLLLFGLILSIFGLVLVAPGGVYIKGYVTKRKHGHIALAGPVMNFLLGGIFLLIWLFIPVQIFSTISLVGMKINFLLGAFNMIPFPIFDGYKVMKWNKTIYWIIFIIARVLGLFALKGGINF